MGAIRIGVSPHRYGYHPSAAGWRFETTATWEERAADRFEERLDPHPGKMLATIEPVFWDKVHEAKAPRIVVSDNCTIGHVEDDVVVRRYCAGFIDILAGLLGRTAGWFDGKTATHAEMHDQYVAC